MTSLFSSTNNVFRYFLFSISRETRGSPRSSKDATFYVQDSFTDNFCLSSISSSEIEAIIAANNLSAVNAYEFEYNSAILFGCSKESAHRSASAVRANSLK
jgi:hypothetical protein